MALTAVYSVEEILDAYGNADMYRMQAAVTGLYEAVDAVIDAEIALNKAGISDKHRDILLLRWVHGYTQAQIAECTGDTRESIAMVEKRSRKKIQVVIDGWAADAV